jgi:hypothetical protein
MPTVGELFFQHRTSWIVEISDGDGLGGAFMNEQELIINNNIIL